MLNYCAIGNRKGLIYAVGNGYQPFRRLAHLPENTHYLAPSLRGDACRWHAFIADRIEDETWLRS